MVSGGFWAANNKFKQTPEKFEWHTVLKHLRALRLPSLRAKYLFSLGTYTCLKNAIFIPLYT